MLDIRRRSVLSPVIGYTHDRPKLLTIGRMFFAKPLISTSDFVGVLSGFFAGKLHPYDASANAHN